MKARLGLFDLTGNRFDSVVADLSEHEARNVAFAQALDALDGQLDILVNCAGISILHKAEDVPYEDYKKGISVNLDAVFELTQLAGRVMLLRYRLSDTVP